MPRRARKPVFWDIENLDDLAEFKSRLQIAAENGQKDHELLADALDTAIRGGNADIVRYLVQQENAPLQQVTPSAVASKPSTQLLQVLVDGGWDINTRRIKQAQDGSTQADRSLLQLVCGDGDLVEWCLDHGASTEDVHPNPVTNPPLLELAARSGSLRTFKILHAREAKIAPRVLHWAADSAAWSTTDETLAFHMEKLRYFLDELQLDVNAMDTEGKMPEHHGTPLCYAVRHLEGGRQYKVAEVTRFLLDRDADPIIKDCWGHFNAIDIAESHSDQSGEVLGMLLESKRKREEERKADAG